MEVFKSFLLSSFPTAPRGSPCYNISITALIQDLNKLLDQYDRYSGKTGNKN